MSIKEIRAKQVAQQSQSIDQRKKSDTIVRIGNYLPATGKYEVLESNGGVDQGGVKVYNAQHQHGDRVLAYPRSDGTIALDSEKGSIVRPPTAFPHCPGYLNGQVFNCEAPKKKPKGKIWILYEYRGRIYVGGHQEIPELVYDPLPANVGETYQYNINAFVLGNDIFETVRACREYGQIWGDGEGWEVTHDIKGAQPSVRCANSSGSQTYTFKAWSYSNILLSNPSEYRHLGKGLFIPEHESSSLAGERSGSWKNAIVDVDGVSTGAGSYARSITSSDPATLSESGTISDLATFPPPYSKKKRTIEASFINRGTMDGLQRAYRKSSEIDSCSIVFRDRSTALFWRTNSTHISDVGVGVIPGRTVDFIVTDGQQETLLFTAKDLQIDLFPYVQDVFYRLLGAVFTTFKPWIRLDAFKFNNANITRVQGADSTVNFKDLYGFTARQITKFTSHNGDTREYDVDVYNIFDKTSLIDGEVSSVETVDAWGIPIGAYVIDVASWVP